MSERWSNGKPKRSITTKYAVGESVRIVHLMPKQEFVGVVTCARPLKAEVTDNDPVWKGCAVTSEGNIRKLRRFVEGCQ